MTSRPTSLISMETSPHRAAREKRASWGQYLDVFPALPMRRVKSPATHSRHCSIQSDTTLIGDEEQEKETEFLSKTNTKVAGCSFMVRRWIRNVKGSYLHPYPREEAPYTISYNRISLNMDMRLHELLDKLNSKASPTFCDLISRPPIRVLDLGCGEGYWVVGAAEHWRKHGTEVIGFDLLDLASNMWEVPAYADGMQPIFSWKQGNFVSDNLPFPDEHFDFVRMSNLGLAIPQHRWAHVLQEARRVLAFGGRLEVIDDELIFPHLPQAYTHTISSLRFHRQGATPVRRGAIRRRRRSGGVISVDGEWTRCSRQAQDLELLYEHMLRERCDIHLQPHLLINDLLDHVFGQINTQKVHKFRVAVPIPSQSSSGETQRRIARSSLLPSSSQPTHLVVRQGNSISFLQMSASEAEDHACKSIHTLLESRVAINEYLNEREWKDTFDRVSEYELEETLWNYECFRRARFRWPLCSPDLTMHEPMPRPKSDWRRSNRYLRHSLDSASTFLKPTNELHVRTIRVYAAVKEEEDPIIPLLWT